MESKLHKTRLLAIIAACVLAMGCGIVSKLVSPQKKMRASITTKVYEKDGLSFSYADNWKISEDEIVSDRVRYLTVEDADNTVFAVTLFPAGYAMELTEYSDSFMEGLKKEIPYGEIVGLKSGETQRIIGDQMRNGIRRNFTMTLLGEKVPHTTDFYSVAIGEREAIIAIQAPDEDWSAAEPEVDVISKSLTF